MFTKSHNIYYRHNITQLKGFNKFYNELKEFLKNEIVDPSLFSALFVIRENVFNQQVVGDNPQYGQERKELGVLLVNQVCKSFESASLLALAQAFEISQQGQDEIFKYKFSKRIATKISLINVQEYPDISMRSLLYAMQQFNDSPYIGPDCWEVLFKLCIKHIKESRLPFNFNEVYTFLAILNRREGQTQLRVSK